MRLLLAAAILLPSALRAETVTLAQCYDWALERTEDLKIRAEDIEQARQRARAALGGVFPKIDWLVAETWQDPKGVSTLNSQGFGGFIAKEQTESKFTLRQPLFSGLKEYSALRGFQKEGARDALQLERARRDLFETVVLSYFGVVGPETSRGNTAAALKLAQDRVGELKGYLRLGKARASELYAAQAREAAFKAALRREEAAIAAAREDLSFLAGRDLSSATLADDSGLAAVPSLDDALARSRERSDIRAQREDAAGQLYRVRYEKGSYWPSLDLLGDYYTKRATFLSAIHWDVALNVDVPIFSGGTTTANVARAAAAYRQSMLVLESLERRAASLVRRVHGELSGAVLESQAQDEAAQAAQKSYDSVKEEYGLGLTTNLEVLEAMDQLLAQRNARDAARLKAAILLRRLGAATETMP